MVRLTQDSTVNPEQIIQPTEAAVAAAVADITVVLAAAAMVVHTADIPVQAILVAKQETLVPVGVLLIQMDSRPMAETLEGNRASLYRIMWPWADQPVVPEATDMQ
jgi:hypothetical protein